MLTFSKVKFRYKRGKGEEDIDPNGLDKEHLIMSKGPFKEAGNDAGHESRASEGESNVAKLKLYHKKGQLTGEKLLVFMRYCRRTVRTQDMQRAEF